MTDLLLNYRPEREAEALRGIRMEEVHPMDLTNTNLEVYIANIDELANEQYALARKNGIGASEASVILGVNPYKTADELLGDKLRTELTAEEKAVGEKTAVKKGRDLEPVIMTKFATFFKQHTFKPSDMYVFKQYPFLKVNFDGVTGTPEQYIPCEIKVVTKTGERHYSPTKAMFVEGVGFLPLPADVAATNNSIMTKAAHYGIPPYYYVQLQMQIMALNASFGYLSVLLDHSWTFLTYFVHRDDAVCNAIIIEGYKFWERVQAAQAKGLTDFNSEQFTDKIVEYMKKHHVPFEVARNALLNGAII